MKALLVAFALLFALPAFGQTAGPSTAMTPTPDARAKQWLTLMDDRNYADAYRQMGNLARNKMSERQFAEKESAVRAPFGAMSSRTLKDVKLTKTLPGMRDGQHARVRFDTQFAHKAQAVESVALVSQDGAWSVVGYSVS